MADIQNSLVVQNVVVSFPALFEPAKRSEKYELTLLLPYNDPQPAKIKALAKAARDKKWPNENTRPKKLHSPFRDAADPDVTESGDALQDKYDGYEGHIIIKTSTKRRPGVVDRKRQEIIDKEEIYGGAKCNVQICAWAYARDEGKRGVMIGLMNVQKVADGQHLGGSNPDPNDVFGAVAGDDDPFAKDGETPSGTSTPDPFD